MSVRPPKNFAEYKQTVQAVKRAKDYSGLFFGYVFHREVSAYVSYVLLRVWPGVKPNFVSVIMIALGVIGSVMLVSTSLWCVVSGIVLVYVSFILDKVDGEIARFKQLQTLRGKYLDEFYHAMVTATFIFFLFIQSAYGTGVVYVGVLTLAVFLSLFRRFERKWCLSAVVLRGSQLTSTEQAIRPRPKLVSFVSDNVLVRLSSIVERFDILILLALMMVLLTTYTGEASYERYFLLGYTFLSVVYTIRWALLNYFGEFERRVHEFSSASSIGNETKTN